MRCVLGFLICLSAFPPLLFSCLSTLSSLFYPLFFLRPCFFFWYGGREGGKGKVKGRKRGTSRAEKQKKYWGSVEGGSWVDETCSSPCSISLPFPPAPSLPPPPPPLSPFSFLPPANFSPPTTIVFTSMAKLFLFLLFSFHF